MARAGYGTWSNQYIEPLRQNWPILRFSLIFLDFLWFYSIFVDFLWLLKKINKNGIRSYKIYICRGATFLDTTQIAHQKNPYKIDNDRSHFKFIENLQSSGPVCQPDDWRNITLRLVMFWKYDISWNFNGCKKLDEKWKNITL